MQMFQIDIGNPCRETNESLYDFKMVQLKYKKTFYGTEGSDTDRTKMKIEELDIDFESNAWIKNYLSMEKGLIKFRIPKTGKYEIDQQSRSSNSDMAVRMGPAMGVTVSLELDLKLVRKLQKLK